MRDDFGTRAGVTATGPSGFRQDLHGFRAVPVHGQLFETTPAAAAEGYPVVPRVASASCRRVCRDAEDVALDGSAVGPGRSRPGARAASSGPPIGLLYLRDV